MNRGLADLKESLVAYLNVEWDELVRIGLRAPCRYKRIEIQKSGGKGVRTVFQPCPETKAIQRAIAGILLNNLPISPAAYAYRPKLSNPLLRQATLHAAFSYTVRVDLRDFFPSIRPCDVLSRLEKTFGQNSGEEMTAFLESSLFVRYPSSYIGLAVGAPSSPSLANYVMNEIDAELSTWASSHQGVYSRYADDLVFSSKLRRNCGLFQAQVRDLLRKTATPRLQINRSKTIYSAVGHRRFVTGLCITDSGAITLGRARKRFYKKLVNEYVAGRLDEKSVEKLRGYLSFARGVEPSFINSCVLKYGGTSLRAVLPVPSEQGKLETES